MRATLVNIDHHAAVETFLAATPAESVFLLGMLERRPAGAHPTEQWWAAWRQNDVLAGLAFTGATSTSAGPGLWSLSGHVDAAPALADALKGRPLPSMCFGPSELVDAVWERLGSPQVRLATHSRSFHCVNVRPQPSLKIRPACIEDLDWLRAVSVSMMKEDLGIDPQASDSAAHEARLQDSIATGRSWIGLKDEERVFRLQVGTQCRYGTQVGGTYVPPEHRGFGIATRGMAAVCTELLKNSPLISLHVREDNLSAVACYQRMGFLPGTPQRLLVR